MTPCGYLTSDDRDLLSGAQVEEEHAARPRAEIDPDRHSPGQPKLRYS